MALNGELTSRQVEALSESGRHRVAANLFLLVRPPRRSWLHMFTCPLSGREHEMGLGKYELVSVPKVKAAVLHYRTLEHDGRCPLCEKHAAGRNRLKQVPFSEAAGLYVQAHKAGWRSSEHRRQWDVSLKTHAAAIWDMPVDAIDTGAITQMLEPRWHYVGGRADGQFRWLASEMTPTLSRVRAAGSSRF
jgi:hypothetical protein